MWIVYWLKINVKKIGKERHSNVKYKETKKKKGNKLREQERERERERERESYQNLSKRRRDAKIKKKMWINQMK